MVLSFELMAVYAQPQLDKVDIYVISKKRHFFSYLPEHKLKGIGNYTKYSIVEGIKRNVFSEALEKIPEALKQKKRKAALGAYILVEFIGTKNDTLAVSIRQGHLVFVNGHQTSIDGKAWVNKYLKGVIAPQLGWGGDTKEKPKKSENASFSGEDDGYEVVFMPNTKYLIDQKNLEYFASNVGIRATERLNRYIYIGIRPKDKRIVSVQFPMNFEDFEKGGMNKVTYQKYLNTLNARLRISEVKNPSRLKADVIYRVLDFEN